VLQLDAALVDRTLLELLWPRISRAAAVLLVRLFCPRAPHRITPHSADLVKVWLDLPAAAGRGR
jgi:hypothetical protein